MSDPSDSKRPEPKLQGLACPRCGCRHMYTVETRSTPHRIIRTRECRHCGRRMKTYEQYSSHAAVFKEPSNSIPPRTGVQGCQG